MVDLHNVTLADDAGQLLSAEEPRKAASVVDGGIAFYDVHAGDRGPVDCYARTQVAPAARAEST